jgi:hypothetical protein
VIPIDGLAGGGRARGRRWVDSILGILGRSHGLSLQLATKKFCYACARAMSLRLLVAHAHAYAFFFAFSVGVLSCFHNT